MVKSVSIQKINYPLNKLGILLAIFFENSPIFCPASWTAFPIKLAAFCTPVATVSAPFGKI